MIFTNSRGIINIDNVIFEYTYLKNTNEKYTIIAATGLNGDYLLGPGNIYKTIEDNIENLEISLLKIKLSRNHLYGSLQILKCINSFFNTTQPIVLLGWSMAGASILNVAEALKNFNIIKLIVFGCQKLNIDIIKLIKFPIIFFHGEKDIISNLNNILEMYHVNKDNNKLYVLDTNHIFSINQDKLQDILFEIFNKILNNIHK